ncbi:MAG: phage tail protein, partial [Tetragenococcus koreensis]|nr:phage tail protein [Lactococcus lactis]MDN6423731.1 phage tail protein [Tetragenococcus koreensis]
MIINVLNKDLVPVTFIDNDIPGLPSYYKDTLIDYLSLGTASFEFTILKSKNNIIQDYSRFFNDETCFSFEKNGKQYAVFPAGSDGFYETDTEITYKCLSLDRELSLEYVDKFDNSSTHTLQWYIDYFELISNNQIEIGRNDVADYTRVIKYDSQDTKLNRLLSLINNFDAEFEFITKLTNNGAVDKIILNIVKKRDDSGKGGIGAIRDDVELVYGKNVKGIERTYNFEFFNASKVIGKDGTNWNSSEFSYINSDGVEEFYKRKNDDTAFAPLSAQKYPAHLRKDSSDIWLRKNFETEYTTPAQMWGYIVQQFKSYAYPQITYKIKTNSNLVSQALDGKLPIQIGDTVTIEDDNFSNEQGDFGLILRARATEIKSSDSNPETNEITFENFVELQNDLSDDLMTQVNQLVDAATPYRAELSTTNGTQFKNGTGSTTLSAHIFKGSATTETVADSYEWSKDGTVVAPTQTITVDASGVADKAVYSFKATVAGKVVASQSVTITNVDDGTNGRSVTNVSQKWRLTTTTATPTQAWSDAGWLTTQPTTTATNKYLWSITRTTFNLAPLTQDVIEQKAVYGDKGDKGDTGNDGRAGKDGVGIKTTVITYASHTNGTTAPTTGYTTTVPSVPAGQFLWTKTVWTYTDNSSETGYSVAMMGLKGDKGDPGNNGTNGIAGKDGKGIKS